MLNPKLLDDLATKFADLLATTPAPDIEKNVRALLGSAFARLDLVSREEFDVQQGVLARARSELSALEARLTALEADKPQQQG